MGYEITKARIDQIEEVVSLWDRLMLIHKEKDPTFFAGVDSYRETYKRRLKNYFIGSNSVIFITLYQDKIIGYVTADFMDNAHHNYNSIKFCEIGDIIIDEGYRQNGLGEKLIDQVKIWASELKADRVQLNVYGNNKEGYDFFKKIGFQDSFHLLSIDC